MGSKRTINKCKICKRPFLAQKAKYCPECRTEIRKSAIKKAGSQSRRKAGKCRICGDPYYKEREGDFKGLCFYCAMKVPVLVVCKGCGKPRTVQAGNVARAADNLCVECVSKPVIAVCSKCKKEREFSHRTVSTKPADKLVCKSCNIIASLKGEKLEPDDLHELAVATTAKEKLFFDRSNIVIHGCTLKLSAKTRKVYGLHNSKPVMAPRCADFMKCRYGAYAEEMGIPEDESCLTLAARKLWPGWYSKKTKDNNLTVEELRLLARMGLNTQAEQNFLNTAYSV